MEAGCTSGPGGVLTEPPLQWVLPVVPAAHENHVYCREGEEQARRQGFCGSQENIRAVFFSFFHF